MWRRRVTVGLFPCIFATQSIVTVEPVFAFISPRGHFRETGTQHHRAKEVRPNLLAAIARPSQEGSDKDEIDLGLAYGGDEESKWEKVWSEEEARRRESDVFSAWGKDDSFTTEVDVAMPVEVVSFDLDDTLWSTKAVIDQANDALHTHLEENHPAIVDGITIPHLMKEIWMEQKTANPGLGDAPINLTELRKASLALACRRAGVDPEPVVESSFLLWWRKRHDVERHLLPGTLPALRELKARGVRLVAITNGNADTDCIDCLRDLFDFCIMAEKVGQRKPERGPFEAAVRRAGYSPDREVGGEWVHVGDDFTSDCVGAKAMRMRTILVPPPSPSSSPVAGAEARGGEGGGGGEVVPVSDIELQVGDKALPLSGGDAGEAGNDKGTGKERPANSMDLDTDPADPDGEAAEVSFQVLGATQLGVEKSSKAPMGGVEMSIGSQGYIADMIMNDFTDAKVDSISDVPGVIERWNRDHNEAQGTAAMVGGGGVGSAEVAAASAEEEKPAAVASGSGKQDQGGSQTRTKFCLGCGEKIPAVAKFCPSCGTKQVAVS